MAYRILVLCFVYMLVVVTLADSVPASDKDKEEPRGFDEDSAESGEHESFPVNQLPPLTYSPKKYTLVMEAVTFPQAWQKCMRRGKRFATVESYADHQAIRKVIAKHAGMEVPFWIAATNMGAKHSEYKKYYWITNDRPVGYLSGFESWLNGEAADEPNQCVFLYLASAMWISGSCDTQAYFICEEAQDV